MASSHESSLSQSAAHSVWFLVLHEQLVTRIWLIAVPCLVFICYRNCLFGPCWREPKDSEKNAQSSVCCFFQHTKTRPAFWESLSVIHGIVTHLHLPQSIEAENFHADSFSVYLKQNLRHRSRFLSFLGSIILQFSAFSIGQELVSWVSHDYPDRPSKNPLTRDLRPMQSLDRQW